MNTTKPKRLTLPSEWPVLLLALPAFVAIWGGWVGLGELTGFGPVNLLPGIGDGWTLNTAITLPIGVEAYAAYALRVWLNKNATRSDIARRFAMWSAIASLVLGMAGQVAYHLMAEAGMTKAPWQVTTFVSCLPVVVLGCGAALAHLSNTGQPARQLPAHELPAAPPAHADLVPRPSPSHAGDEPNAVSPAFPPDRAGETAPEPPTPGDPPAASPARPARSVLRPAQSPARPKRVARPGGTSGTARLTDEDLGFIARLRDARDPETGDLPTESWMRKNLGVGQGRAARLRKEAARPDLHTVKEVAVG